jgi:hypothetical protein
MAIRLSTGLRNRMLAGGANGGLKLALDGGFINIYTGSQPVNADSPATGTLLGKVSVNADGVTGITFDDPSAGSISKAADELWRFLGLAQGNAGWFRFHNAADNPATLSTSSSRIDGSIGTGMADLNLSNVAVVENAPCTIDVFTFTLPAQ